jgi:hypothetical protein
MNIKHRILIGLVAVISLLSSATPTRAAWIYANGGKYYMAKGPSQYWHYDIGEGYCGKYAKWCSPYFSAWTYNQSSSFGYTNGAVWRIDPAQQYFSRAYAFIPRRNATADPAFYAINYAIGSNMEIGVNQLAFYDQWAPLTVGNGLFMVANVYLDDNRRGYGSPGKVAFDEIKIEN